MSKIHFALICEHWKLRNLRNIPILFSTISIYFSGIFLTTKLPPTNISLTIQFVSKIYITSYPRNTPYQHSSAKPKSLLYWKTALKESILKRFSDALSEFEQTPEYDLRSQVSILGLFHRLQDIVGNHEISSEFP